MSAADEAGVLLLLSETNHLDDVVAFARTHRFLLSAELDFVREYAERYGKPPGKAILLSKFPKLAEYDIDGEFAYYYDQLKTSKMMEMFQSTVAEADRMVKKDGPEQGIQFLLKRLTDSEIAIAPAQADFVDLGDSNKIVQMVRSRIEARLLGTVGYPTGFVQIDREGIGLMAGEMLGIMARPGVAKSWLLLHSAYRAWNAGARVIFISPEMAKDEMMFRFMPLIAFDNGMRISNKQLRSGTFSDMTVLRRTVELMRSKDNMFQFRSGDEKSGVSTEYIQRLCQQYHPDVIAIDGVRLFATGRTAAWEQQDAAFYGLQQLAVASNVAIIVAHQANRGASNTSNAPKASDAAGGDAILKACTYLVTVAMDTASVQTRYTTLQKNRFGEMDTRRVNISYNVDIGDIGRTPQA